jgi:hypothetical protein
MTGWIRFATFVAVAAILATATGGAGATTSPKQTPAATSHVVVRGHVDPALARRASLLRTADLTTRAGAVRYLRAIGLNPRHVVVQQGRKNYAGPKCPGSGWTCTNARRVLQIGTVNFYSCTPPTTSAPPNTCTIIQHNGTGNGTATCTETSTGPVQSCTITQDSSSGSNTASVTQTLGQLAFGNNVTQNATQNAIVMQTSVNGANNATVRQLLGQAAGQGSSSSDEDANDADDFTQPTSSPIKQAQEARQNAYVNQKATGTGSNTSSITQGQLQVERADHAPSIMQTQNVATQASAPAACPTLSPTDDVSSNQCNTVQQQSVSGTNNSKVQESYNQFQAASNCCATTPGTQIQGLATQGGIDHRFQQCSNGSCTPSTSGGLSTQSSNQVERQIQRRTSIGAAGIAHEQHGPVKKGTGLQFGNGGNTATQTQSSTQISTPDTGTQTNLVSDMCVSQGNCSVTQTVTENGQTTTNTASGSVVNAQTACTGSTCTPTTGNPPTVTISGNQISATNVDVGEFGFGGMRGNGTGSITVSGVSGVIARAFLYWHGPTNSSDPASNAAVTFNGTPITGTNIGTSGDNCWGFANSQSYRADVTPLVTGNGSYSLSNFTKPDADINGVSLIVFYSDGNPANDRNVVLWNGNDSNFASTFDAQGWDQTITGVPYAGGSASLDFVVSDGQSFPDDALVLNGQTLVPAGAIFSGDSTPSGPFNSSGDLWDVKSFDITSFLTPGSNNLHLTTGLAGDCLSLVVAAANVPASAPIG